MTDILRPPAFLPPKPTLAISSRAPQILKALGPGPISLPFPFSLFTNSESPEKWQIYENLLVSCLKTGDDESAFLCVEELISRFGPNNERVQALRGLYQEAMAKDDAALQEVLQQYEDIIKENPINMHVRKRRAALLKSMGKTQEAVRALVKVLDVSPVDAEAWAELAELYMGLGLYEKSVYCWEEVLLVMPNAWNAHARLGETEWVWASTVEETKEKLKLVSSSLRRYCRSIELCDDYLRGYYGLKLTAPKLIEILSKNQRTNTMDAGDLAPPPLPALESLNELATSKLAEIVRRGAAKETGWDGYEEAELIAARALLDRDTQKVQR